MPKTLIVDACLAVDAGSKSPPAIRGARVRSFLLAVLGASHRVGFTFELESEWKQHAALFARSWLRTMRARRRVDRLSPSLNLALRDRALATAANDSVSDAMEKDWHLVVAAFATDRIIASSDDRARGYYATASTTIAALKSLVWVNPATNDLKTWVEDDVPSDQSKRLG